MSNRKVEVLRGEEWVEIEYEKGLSALTEGDQFKLYEPDGTLVGDTSYLASGAPYERDGEFCINADPVNEQVQA